MVAMAGKNKSSSLGSKLILKRMWVQAAFLLLWIEPLWFGAWRFRYHGMCSPVFHCYACPLATFACPIGVLASFTALHIWPFVAIGVLIAIGALFGTLICGWVCPFGFFQDLLGKIPTPKFDPPRWAGHMRYVVLIGAVLMVPYLFGKDHPLFICNFCTVAAVEAVIPYQIAQARAGDAVTLPNPYKLTLLILFLVAILFMKRPWCRILCPLGAIFSLFNRVSAFFLRVDREACTDCGRCHTLCDLGIEPEKSPNDSRCVRCLECTRCGPKALKFSSIFSRKRSKTP